MEKQGKISVLENDILHNNENINRIEGEIGSIISLDKNMDKELDDRNLKIEESNES